MHMADALLSPAVGGTMLAVSSGILAFSARDIRKNFQEKRIPLMGMAGAFVFAAQMVNFAIPGTGSSGHIGGAVLLSVLLGPTPAFLVLAGVLLVQAFFFADGGLLAWGCNLFNMGFFGCFLAVPLVYRPVAGKTPGRGRIVAASLLASIVSLELGAFAVTLETLVSGVTELPFPVFAGAMLPIHFAIAIGEGLATAGVLLFVRKQLPEIETLRLEVPRTNAVGRLAAILGIAALFIGGGLSLVASGAPDGLEWSIGRTAGTATSEHAGAVHSLFAAASEHLAIFPDYNLPNHDGMLGTSLSGLAGPVICIVLLAAIGFLLCRKPTSSGGK